MKNYYRVMLGRKSIHAAECLTGEFIGTDFGIREDLSGKLPEEWRAFNKQVIKVFLAKNLEKLRWALVSVPSISFYRYQISFKLVKR